MSEVFKTRRDIEDYFSGDTIECLICHHRFKRLHGHLAAKHAMTVDDYKTQFGLPWTRGLTSATSLANSGWTEERKAKARKVAQRSQFFKFAHFASRRELAPFAKTEAIEHLGINPEAFGDKFDEQLRTLLAKGLGSRTVARVLRVGRTTVLRRIRKWGVKKMQGRARVR
jgi:ROS/MUCR transcriptional regulator protein